MSEDLFQVLSRLRSSEPSAEEVPALQGILPPYPVSSEWGRRRTIEAAEIVDIAGTLARSVVVTGDPAREREIRKQTIDSLGREFFKLKQLLLETPLREGGLSPNFTRAVKDWAQHQIVWGLRHQHGPEVPEDFTVLVSSTRWRENILCTVEQAVDFVRSFPGQSSEHPLDESMIGGEYVLYSHILRALHAKTLGGAADRVFRLHVVLCPDFTYDQNSATWLSPANEPGNTPAVGLGSGAGLSFFRLVNPVVGLAKHFSSFELPVSVDFTYADHEVLSPECSMTLRQVGKRSREEVLECMKKSCAQAEEIFSNEIHIQKAEAEIPLRVSTLTTLTRFKDNERNLIETANKVSARLTRLIPDSWIAHPHLMHGSGRPRDRSALDNLIGIGLQVAAQRSNFYEHFYGARSARERFLRATTQLLERAFIGRSLSTSLEQEPSSDRASLRNVPVIVEDGSSQDSPSVFLSKAYNLPLGFPREGSATPDELLCLWAHQRQSAERDQGARQVPLLLQSSTDSEVRELIHLHERRLHQRGS